MKNLEDLKYYDAYLIDWDGTVANTRYVHLRSHIAAFERFGIKMTAEQAESTIDNLWPALRERVAHDRIKRIEEYIGKISNSQIVEAPLFPGAIDALGALHEQAQGRLAVVSNAYGDALQKAVHHNGLNDLFEVVISGSDVEYSKPNPEGVCVALQELDINPGQALMFDDSNNGLRAAMRAEVRQVHFNPGGNYVLDSDIMPMYTIESWDEVTNALQYN